LGTAKTAPPFFSTAMPPPIDVLTTVFRFC
jgi:hypothetical protein